MMTATKCPTADDLRAYSAGRLSEAETDSLYEHLSNCSVCQSELETIDDSEDSLIADLRTPDQHASVLEEPQCNLALAKALATLAETDAHSSRGKIHDWAEDSEGISAGSHFPEQTGEYKLIRPIGRGGMGKVYLALQTKLGRQVAIKVMASHRLADRRMRERFDAEMRAVGRLSHPNIVTAHDAREVDGAAVLITEYIDGYDLAEIIHRTGPLSIANATEIIRKVAAALQYVSDQGFIHRDVKPSNIMISRHGEVKLLDLGLARFESADELMPGGGPGLTGTGQAIGTPDYVAPEQVTDGRDVDHRTDIYSLGCTLFTLLTGHAPFSDSGHQSAFAKMTAHVSQLPPSLPDALGNDASESCPIALKQLLDSMLEKDPERRPQSSGVVATSLATWSQGHDLVELVSRANESEPRTRPLPLSTAVRAKSWRRRTVPLPAVLLIAIGFGLIGLMMGMFIRIKYPDGTVIELPVSGADVAFHETPAKTQQPATRQPANGSKTIRPAVPAKVPGLPSESDSEKPVDAVPRPADVSEVNDPFGSAGKSKQTAVATQISFAKMQGVWKLTSYENAQQETPDVFLLGVHRNEIFSVVVNGDQPPVHSAGEVLALQKRGQNLSLRVREFGTGEHEFICQFVNGDRMKFFFDPFGQIDKLPFQKARNPIRGDLVYQFARAGEFPPTDVESVMTESPQEKLALVTLNRMQEKGTKKLVQVDENLIVQTSGEKTKNQLKLLAIAFHNFHSTYGKIPGSANTLEAMIGASKDKVKPCSWRVAILPFIGEAALFEQYRFDQPWDSESNRRLLEKMPDVYRSPNAPADQPASHTNYLGYSSAKGALEKAGGTSFREFRDGLSNTLLLIETKHTVPWTKPEDLDADVEVEFFDPITYLLGDGSVHQVKEIDRDRLRKMITRDGGEIIR